MDFVLKEIGFTLLTGALAIAGFELVLRFILKKSVIDFLRDPIGSVVGIASSPDDPHEMKTSRVHSMFALVFIGFSFVLGLLAEDLSDKREDCISLPVTLTSPLPRWVPWKPSLPTFDYGVSILVGELSDPRAEPLAKDLANSGAFRKVDNENGERVEEWILSAKTNKLTGMNEWRTIPNQVLSDKAVKDSIKTLHYFSKNWAYGHPNHYDELSRIKSRKDFTRSFALITLIQWLIGFFLALIIAGCALVTLSAKQPKRKVMSNPLSWKWMLRVSLALVILLVFNLLGVWAYQRESEAYNKRVFGYYSSKLIAERPEALNSDRNSNESNSNLPATDAITLAQFDQIGTDPDYYQVLSKTDPKGQRKSNPASGYETITYQWGAPAAAQVTILFFNGKLIHKSQHGLK